MCEHRYFTVEPTALTIPKRGALAIYCGDAPTRYPDGRASHQLRAPMLLIPPDMFTDTAEIANEVAKVLNENAHRFYPNAPKPSASDDASKPSPSEEPNPLPPRHPATRIGQ